MLENINQRVDDTLNELENLPSEDEKSDELVLKLQELIQERQILLDDFKDDNVEVVRTVLNEQLLITQSFEKRASKVLLHIQSLLNLRKKNQRQISIYQSVDSNK
ncbi:hypothetical protein L2737_05690 [Shewanella electrodiphila]|uniref:Uncharacterized protein n=1 Tax=Shewanella electrodiphila TaxID=934143 RepID=A0ABT0KLV1_9GAMM|nr:hypothetical protein [Shewanella electrodiphila]MCL1044818.1 hypothetical protein [Shewanella electrodiphila]